MDDCCRIAELLLGGPPERRVRAHHRLPDDRELLRPGRLGGLHGEPPERGRHQHRRRVHSAATPGTWPGSGLKTPDRRRSLPTLEELGAPCARAGGLPRRMNFIVRCAPTADIGD
jgi:hypothetical protein